MYDTQVRLPFIAFGPMARGMPKRVPGVWSDTAIGPTLLEALGLRHRDCRGALPGALDLFGCSVLSSPPPRHAMVSCAFDSTCVGLVTQREPAHGGAPGGSKGDGALAGSKGGRTQLWKFASFGEERLEAYRLDADPYEVGHTHEFDLFPARSTFYLCDWPRGKRNDAARFFLRLY